MGIAVSAALGVAAVAIPWAVSAACASELSARTRHRLMPVPHGADDPPADPANEPFPPTE